MQHPKQYHQNIQAASNLHHLQSNNNAEFHLENINNLGNSLQNRQGGLNGNTSHQSSANPKQFSQQIQYTNQDAKKTPRHTNYINMVGQDPIHQVKQQSPKTSSQQVNILIQQQEQLEFETSKEQKMKLKQNPKIRKQIDEKSSQSHLINNNNEQQQQNEGDSNLTPIQISNNNDDQIKTKNKGKLQNNNQYQAQILNGPQGISRQNGVNSQLANKNEQKLSPTNQSQHHPTTQKHQTNKYQQHAQIIAPLIINRQSQEFKNPQPDFQLKVNDQNTDRAQPQNPQQDQQAITHKHKSRLQNNLNHQQQLQNMNNLDQFKVKLNNDMRLVLNTKNITAQIDKINNLPYQNNNLNTVQFANKRNVLQSAGVVGIERSIERKNQISIQTEINAQKKMGQGKQGSIEGSSNGTTVFNQISTKSSFNENGYHEQKIQNQRNLAIKSQLRMIKKPQALRNGQSSDRNNVQGIYADEFNLNDSQESFEQIQKFKDSVHDYQNCLDLSPDQIAMRNTVHGAGGGFFDQRNQKINMKQGQKQSMAVQQFQPQLMSSKKTTNKFSLDSRTKDQSQIAPQSQVSGLPILSKTSKNFFTRAENNHGAQSPDLYIDKSLLQYQQYTNPKSRKDKRIIAPHQEQSNTNYSPIQSQYHTTDKYRSMAPINGYQTFTNFMHSSNNQQLLNSQQQTEVQGNQSNIVNPSRKYKIRFQVNTKNDVQVDQQMMQSSHKENLNLLFYDFNCGSKQAQIKQKQLKPLNKEQQDSVENFQNDFDPQEISNGQFYNIMTNTGSNFYTKKFGDRLPTREVKSRRGRDLTQTSQGTRALSINHSKNFDINQRIVPESRQGNQNGAQQILSCSPREYKTKSKKTKDQVSQIIKNESSNQPSNQFQQQSQWYHQLNNKAIGEQDEDNYYENYESDFSQAQQKNHTNTYKQNR
eukprot:403362068